MTPKWRQVGNMTRMDRNNWIRKATEWKPWGDKRKQRKPTS